MRNEGIICIKSWRSENMDALKRVIQLFSSEIVIVSLSSVYLVHSLNEDETYRSTEKARSEGLVVSFSFQAQCEASTLVSLIKSIENQVLRDLDVRLVIKLLVFGAKVSIVPSLVLPFPNFHNKAEEIDSAAEVWPDYIHPVLNKSLIQLRKALKGVLGGQFYAQGKSLLDKAD